MGGRLSWPCWLTDSGRLNRKVVTHPASSLAQDRESSPAETSVLTTMLRSQKQLYNYLSPGQGSGLNYTVNSSHCNKHWRSHVFLFKNRIFRFASTGQNISSRLYVIWIYGTFTTEIITIVLAVIIVIFLNVTTKCSKSTKLVNNKTTKKTEKRILKKEINSII